MTTTRQIDAYRRRLAKIEHAQQLTTQCLGAVAEIRSSETTDNWTTAASRMGTLVSFTHRQAVGLFGMHVTTDVRLCPECVGRHGDCRTEAELELTDVVLVQVVRNALEDLAAAGLLQAVG